jgi:hypothetical protein
MLIETWCAHPLGDEPPESLEILAEQTVPDFHDLDEARAHYQQQAIQLCDGLLQCLPQGLTDALLAELCWRKASLCRVAQERREGEACSTPPIRCVWDVRAAICGAASPAAPGCASRIAGTWASVVTVPAAWCTHATGAWSARVGGRPRLAAIDNE